MALNTAHMMFVLQAVMLMQQKICRQCWDPSSNSKEQKPSPAFMVLIVPFHPVGMNSLTCPHAPWGLVGFIQPGSVDCRYPQGREAFHVAKHVETTKGNWVGNIFHNNFTTFDVFNPYSGWFTNTWLLCFWGSLKPPNIFFGYSNPPKRFFSNLPPQFRLGLYPIPIFLFWLCQKLHVNIGPAFARFAWVRQAFAFDCLQGGFGIAGTNRCPGAGPVVKRRKGDGTSSPSSGHAEKKIHGINGWIQSQKTAWKVINKGPDNPTC